MKPPHAILIVQTAFIGDVILATALVESLHAKFPSSSIDFLLRKGNEELLTGHPCLRHVLVFDKRRKYRNLFLLIKKIRATRYDVVINVQRFATTGIMTVLSGAKRTIGFDKNPLSFLFSVRVPHVIGEQHEVLRNHQLIEAMAGKDWCKPRLYPSAANFEKISEFSRRPYITVSPASIWFTKQFPPEKWIAFLSATPAPFQIFFLGAKSDYDLCAQISAGIRERSTNLAGELSMLESAALMRDAAMNYVNDSAPMHLASSMNAPVAAIYCSTIPSFGFGPLSDKSFVIETPENLACRPCGLHGQRACPQGHFKCALTIEKEQLLAVL